MSITNTYKTTNNTDRQVRQSELHRRCILILTASRRRG